jgi:hypothetical protein
VTPPTNTGNPPPRKGLSDPESAQNPKVDTERHPGGSNGPQTGAQRLGGEPTPPREGRQPAYEAVFTYIRALGQYLPPDPAHRNAIIWSAVHAALNAVEPPDSGPTVAECRDHDRRWPLEREGE